MIIIIIIMIMIMIIINLIMQSAGQIIFRSSASTLRRLYHFETFSYRFLGVVPENVELAAHNHLPAH